MKKYIVALALLASASGASAANILVNGNFEAGNLSGWSNVTGRVYVDNNNGGGTPVSNRATPFNANGGSFFAVGDMTGPGSEILLQSFTVTGEPVTVSFDWFNRSAATQSGTSLSGSQSNRVDILTAGAGAYDVGAGVVANLLLNQTSNNWQSALFTLNLAAGNYQFRFGSSTCCNFQNFGIDNVSVTEAAAEVPEPAMIALFGLGAAALGFGRRRRKAA